MKLLSIVRLFNWLHGIGLFISFYFLIKTTFIFYQYSTRNAYETLDYGMSVQKILITVADVRKMPARDG